MLNPEARTLGELQGIVKLLGTCVFPLLLQDGQSGVATRHRGKAEEKSSLYLGTRKGHCTLREVQHGKEHQGSKAIQEGGKPRESKAL